MNTELKITLSATLKNYLSRIALLYYGSLEREYDDMLRKFVRVAPWAAHPALQWEAPPEREEVNTVLAHIAPTTDLHELMQKTIKEINVGGHAKVTSAIFVHTAIVWWTTYIYPQRDYH